MLQRVFVDANVFRSKTQMDWLFLLRRETEGSFQLHATEDVLAEVAYTMRRDHPTLDGGVVKQRLDLIRECLDELLGDFSGDVPFNGRDEHDRHIHAAALACSAHLLLTNDKPSNITTTPEAEHYEIISPDDFFVLLADSFPPIVASVAREQADYWAKRGTDRTLAEALERASCPNFARRVEFDTTSTNPFR